MPKKVSQAAENYAEEAMEPVWATFPEDGVEWNDEMSDKVGVAAWDAVSTAYQAGIHDARKAVVKAIRGLS